MLTRRLPYTLLLLSLLFYSYSLSPLQEQYLSAGADRPLSRLLQVSSLPLIALSLSLIFLVSIRHGFSLSTRLHVAIIGFASFFVTRELISFLFTDRPGSLISLLFFIALSLLLNQLSPAKCKPEFLLDIHHAFMFYFSFLVLVNILIFAVFYNNSIFFWNDRFNGIFPHPQFAGIQFALAAIFFLCLSLLSFYGNHSVESMPSLAGRSIYVILFVFSLFLLFHSGSRTGFLSLVICFLVSFLLFPRRVRKRLLNILPFIVFPPLSFLFIYGTSSIQSRIIDFSSLNGREVIWSKMSIGFFNNILFGNLSYPPGSESSYLAIAYFGGLALLVLFLFYCLSNLSPFKFFRIARFRFQDNCINPNDYRVTSLMLAQGAFCLVYLISSISEGFFLFDRITVNVGILFFIALAVLGVPRASVRSF